MFVPFNTLEDHTRLWVYQSPRKFTSEELDTISDVLTTFTTRWSAHGQPLKSSFQLVYDQFILLAVDEDTHAASGCSIDDSTRTMKALSNTLGLDLFDRTLVFFVKDGIVEGIPLGKLKDALHQGRWSAGSEFVNTLAAQKGELKNGMLSKAETSWLRRYLPTERVAG